MTRKNGRILSGIQPTGHLHLGNYLGAIRNWVAMQDDYDCLYCIVDLHAITLPQTPKDLHASIREVAAALIASGIDTNTATLFPQSAVAGHAQLAWYLACMTPLGWLNRMTQFKEKAGKKRDNAPLGLYAYPVLMAADILLYKATHVPVGEDQKQHLELTRDIAGAFNRQYGTDFFPLPEPVIPPKAARIMSLRDGTKKMSKSDASDYARINLTDDADTIALKIKKAKTDSEPLPSEIKGLEGRAEAANLVTIFAALAEKTEAGVLAQYGGAAFSTFKADLADLTVTQLAPISQKMTALLKDRRAIDTVLEAGAAKADALAQKHLKDIHALIGF